MESRHSSKPCVLWMVLTLAGTASGQPSAARFDTASVKPSSPADRAERRFRVTPGGLDIQDANVLYRIGQAFDRPIPRIVYSGAQIAGLLRGSYTIQAKSGQRASREEVMAMLQSLLTERFHLNVHHEARTGPLYRLVVAKGDPKLQKSAAEFPANIGMGLDWIESHGAAMSQLAFILTGRMGSPVVDETQLTGLYDFRLKLDTLALEPAPDNKAAGEFWTYSSIFGDIQRQLGLKLDGGKGAVDYLVIDSLQALSEN
jgi:uncharacterized protein (TIGR03435 family)